MKSNDELFRVLGNIPGFRDYLNAEKEAARDLIEVSVDPQIISRNQGKALFVREMLARLDKAKA